MLCLILQNSGITQGKFLRRSKILKSGTACQNQFWHWKDFRLGMEIPLNGVPIKLIDCDAFTRVSHYSDKSKLKLKN